MHSSEIKSVQQLLIDHLRMNMHRASEMLITDATDSRKCGKYGCSYNRKNKELRDILKQIRRDSIALEKLMKLD